MAAARSRGLVLEEDAEHPDSGKSMSELLSSRRNGYSAAPASRSSFPHAGHKRGRAGITHSSTREDPITSAADEHDGVDAHGSSSAEDDAASTSRKRARRKHAPTEMPSTRPVSRRRDTVAVSKYKPRDPRFEEASGDLKPDLFQRSYAFLNDYRAAEISALRDAVKRERSTAKTEELQGTLRILMQQQSERQRAVAVASALQSHKRVEAAAVAAGKKPFYLKRRDKRAVAVVARYKQLEGTVADAAGTNAGGAARVDAALKRRRKKMLARSQ